ncbi:uncharacterized protein [Garra rufa]|uniref:uncharacterized protein n=1 Tax=Garra rufa TaxID=137080 RepID=UPI003CCEC36B
MADKCHLCLLGLIFLSSLLTGTSGVDDAHVFISSGENVCLPCYNALHDCKSTTWNYNNRHSATVELIAGGIKKNDTESHERLSLGSDCSLNIKNITKDDYGLYTCRQYVNGQQQRTDTFVYLHVLHVSSSSSQTEISRGSSVSLSCQLYSYSYTGVSCDDWIRSEGIELFWVNQAGVKLTISDSRYQILFSLRHCIITLTTTLLNEDDNREWRCKVTHRNQVKTSATYTVKSSAQDKTTAAVIPVSITNSQDPSTTSTHRTKVFVIAIVVGASFAVLLPALILCLIWKKRAGVRRATDDSVEQTDDVIYTEVTVNKKKQATKKVRCDDKVTYASIRGAEAGAQENCSPLYVSKEKMADKCHLCLLGLIIVSSLLTGTSGVDDAHVFISSGENVHLPCNNALPDCKSTTWSYNRFRHSAAVELIGLGIKKKGIETHERLSLGSDCSLNIKNFTKEDYGSYICQQYVDGQKWGTDAHVYLHVLHVSSSSSQTEISPGSSVTLSCQLYSSYGVSCEDWIHFEGIEVFWVNQTGVKLTISDSRYQISAPGHCISNLTTTLLNEDDNREWRCNLTHRNQVKTSATFTLKSSVSSSNSETTSRQTPAAAVFRGTAHLYIVLIVIIVEFAVFAAPTVILLQIICARRAERKDSQHREEIVMNTILE